MFDFDVITGPAGPIHPRRKVQAPAPRAGASPPDPAGAPTTGSHADTGALTDPRHGKIGASSEPSCPDPG